MQFNKDAQLDTSQINDTRGRGGGGRGGGRIAMGGGGGLLALILAVFFGIQLQSPDSTTTAPADDAPTSTDNLAVACQTGADVADNPDCRYVVYVNSIQGFWSGVFERAGERYPEADTNVFTDGIQTGCGAASAAVGPFYCPADQQIYLDLGFFNELTTKFGGQGGDFAEAYVLAHEYGHHISNLTGSLGQVRPGSGPQSDGVRLELQADCYAGLWARNAESAPGPDGKPLIQNLTREDILEGLDAARIVGDDYIQDRFQGTVSPETWTHGSSEQRQKWFLIGYEKGSFQACDTFRIRTV